MTTRSRDRAARGGARVLFASLAVLLADGAVASDAALPDALRPKADAQYLRGDAREGCGAASGASLLWWWAQVKGVRTLPVPGDPEWSSPFDEGYAAAQAELGLDMGAFGSLLGVKLPGQQRAVWPTQYLSGLQVYLERRDVPLVARGFFGAGPDQREALLARLRRQFDRSEPVVALLVSPAVQHYGTLRAYRVDDRGDVWGTLNTPVRGSDGVVAHELNLTAPSSLLSGLYWLERRE